MYIYDRQLSGSPYRRKERPAILQPSHRYYYQGFGEAVDRGAQQKDKCGKIGAAREVDPQNPPFPPLIYKTGDPRLLYKRAIRPTVGYAQKLLNTFLERYAAGKADCVPGADIASIEQLRKKLKHGDRLKVDCYFWTDTDRATRMFQICQGLKKVDGKIGKETWKRLEALQAGPPPITPPVTPPVTPPSCVMKVVRSGTLSDLTPLERVPVDGGPVVGIELENLLPGSVTVEITNLAKGSSTGTLLVGVPGATVSGGLGKASAAFLETGCTGTKGIPYDFLLKCASLACLVKWKILTNWVAGDPNCCP